MNTQRQPDPAGQPFPASPSLADLGNPEWIAAYRSKGGNVTAAPGNSQEPRAAASIAPMPGKDPSIAAGRRATPPHSPQARLASAAETKMRRERRSVAPRETFDLGQTSSPRSRDLGPFAELLYDLRRGKSARNPVGPAATSASSTPQASTALTAGELEELKQTLLRMVPPAAPAAPPPVVPKAPAPARKPSPAPAPFDRVIAMQRVEAERWLGTECPRGLIAMRGAEAAIGRRDVESLSQAVGSIRRGLVSLANAVQPPGPEQVDHTGTEIACDEQAYKNRLIVFFKKTRGGGASRLAIAELELQAKRLRRLVETLGKGVHSDVVEADVRQLYYATWGLIAEVAASA